MTTSTLAFIGAGNMACSIIGGVIASGFPATSIIATARSQKTIDKVTLDFGIKTTTDNIQAAENADIIILCVKPAQSLAVLGEIAQSVNLSKKLLLSVVASVTCNSICEITGQKTPVIRTMPNTPSILRCGATGVFSNHNVSKIQKELAEKILLSFGKVLWVDNEQLLHNVTAVSGSGPAYFFLFMESMVETAIAHGLSKEQATLLTVQTALGAASMAENSEISLTDLRSQVTSPGGTTERAIVSFENNNLRAMVHEAMTAAYKRSEEISRQQAID